MKKNISPKNILGFFIRVHTSCTHICRKSLLTVMSMSVFCLCPPLRDISGSDNTVFSSSHQKPTFPMHRPNLIYSPVCSLTNVLDYIICVENIVGMKITRGWQVIVTVKAV